MQLLLLHFLLARGPAAGSRTPSRPPSALCGDRAAHRTHPVAVGHSPTGADGKSPVRGGGRRRPGRTRRPSTLAPGGAADLRTEQPPQAPDRNEWSGAGVPVKAGRPEPDLHGEVMLPAVRPSYLRPRNRRRRCRRCPHRACRRSRFSPHGFQGSNPAVSIREYFTNNSRSKLVRTSWPVSVTATVSLNEAPYLQRVLAWNARFNSTLGSLSRL